MGALVPNLDNIRRSSTRKNSPKKSSMTLTCASFGFNLKKLYLPEHNLNPSQTIVAGRGHDP